MYVALAILFVTAWPTNASGSRWGGGRGALSFREELLPTPHVFL
jgi:hypothetical protein